MGMNLTPREKDKLLVAMAAIVASRRLERGVKLNYPEAVALITDYVREHRRQADPGRLPLAFFRDQPGAQLRPRQGVRLSSRYPGRHGRAFRTGTDARGPARLLCRCSARRRVPRPGQREGLTWRA